jgi:hypothetical protein
MVVGEMSGGPFGAIGAFAGALLVTAFLTVFVCALVLQVTKLATDVEKSKQPLTEVRGFSLETMRDHSTKIRPQSPRDWPYLPGSALDSLEAVVPVYSGDQPAAHWSNLRWAERRRPATAPRSRLGASGSLQQSASARAICLQGHYRAKRLLPRLKSGVSGARGFMNRQK